jgi:endoglucanase
MKSRSLKLLKRLTEASAVSGDESEVRRIFLDVLEGSPAADSFGNSGEDTQGVLGDGVQIRLYDPTMIPKPGLRDLMIDLAESEGIPYQVLVRDKGGTDAGQIHLHGHGVPTIVLAVPVRYAHSPTGLIHADDYDNTLALVNAAVKKLDAATVAAFVE